MPNGTYTLLLTLDEPATVEIGALGERGLEPGAYAYSGSAFGPGGLEARVARHRRLAAGQADVRHWHVDYLLGVARLEAISTAPGEAIECAVARSLPGDRVADFGANDCDCGSHLAYAPAEPILRGALQRLYDESTVVETP